MLYGYHTRPTGVFIESRSRFKKWEPIWNVDETGNVSETWPWNLFFEFMKGISVNYIESANVTVSNRNKVFKYKHVKACIYCYKVVICDRKASVYMRGLSPDISVHEFGYRYLKDTRVIAKELSRYIRSAIPGDASSIFQNAGITKGCIYKRLSRENADYSFKKMLEKYVGLSIVTLTTVNPFPELQNNAMFTTVDGEHYIKYLSWCAPFARSVIMQCDVIELDASFRVTSPYVYYLITAVKGNNSVPVGFTILHTIRPQLVSSLHSYTTRGLMI